MRNATQLISFVNVIIAVIPPVFYPISTLPDPLQLVSYFVPTTHASLMLQYSMGFPVPDGWSIYLGLLVRNLFWIFYANCQEKGVMARELSKSGS